MDKTHELAVVGDASSIRLFHALGMRTEEAENAADAERAVHRLARDGCSVIYITEQAAALIPETLKKYKTQTYPAIIPIPNRSGSTGMGMRGIRENVEKAVDSALF